MRWKKLLIASVIASLLLLSWQLYTVWSGKIISRRGQVVSGDLSDGFVVKSAGWDYSLRLEKDGSIASRGLNDCGECNTPLSNTSFYTSDGDIVSLKDVAGDYYFGDGLGVNCSLTLSIQGEFTFIWRGCLGIYDENEGIASIKDGVLHIEPNKPNIRECFQGTPTDFFPVRWGSRMYLIPINEIVDFCSEVNQGKEPRSDIHGHYYLRETDWKKPVTCKPLVPVKWTKYLLSKPIKGKITQLIGKQEGWFDVGSDAGILEGMILTAKEHDNIMFSMVRVEAVEKGRSRIRCEWADSELVVGQTVSSRFHE